MNEHKLMGEVARMREACANVLGDEARRYLYPWAELEQDIASSGSPLRLVGYGSLLNPRSARRTIPSTPPDGHLPVLAFGARRVFNYVMPDSLFARCGEKPPAVERAALNMDWTGVADDYFNGRVIEVPVSDLEALREREQGYHLDPVLWIPWRTEGAPAQVAYVLRADDTPWHGRVVIDDSILPNIPYVNLCREGARLVDELFEELLLTTTWLADRRTRLDGYLSALAAGIAP